MNSTDTDPDPTRPLRIGALLFEGLDQIDLTGPCRVFSVLPNSSYRLYGKTTAAIHDAHGLVLQADATLEDAAQLDVVHIPGGPGQEALMDDEVVLDWIRRQAAGAGCVFSVCTGALLLGAAGLLVGRRATTHWASLDLLPLFGATAPASHPTPQCGLPLSRSWRRGRLRSLSSRPPTGTGSTASRRAIGQPARIGPGHPPWAWTSA